jgi:hypothetical protein
MRRLLLALTVLVLGACNLFGPKLPDGFDGWHHLDHPGRTTSIAFGEPNILEIHDLGCDQSFVFEQEWVSGDDRTVVATQATGMPRFSPDPSVSGALLANPGMYSSSQEQWLPGASCLVCPAGDAGIAVACDAPVVRDGGP